MPDKFKQSLLIQMAELQQSLHSSEQDFMSADQSVARQLEQGVLGEMIMTEDLAVELKLPPTAYSEDRV